MHYLIDGYNLLFRVVQGERTTSLQSLRKEIIESFNQLSLKQKLNLSLIFDAARCAPTELTRGHYDALEIVYTAENQTADEYMIECVSVSKNPAQITVVSSDLKLGKQIRHYGAKTMLIGDFLAFILRKNEKTTKIKSHRFKESPAEIKRLQKIFEDRFKEIYTPSSWKLDNRNDSKPRD